MTRISLFVFCSLFFFQFYCSAPFSSNSFTVVGRGTNGDYLSEYDVLGNLLQTMSLPAGKKCSGCLLNADSTGGITLLSMYTGSSPYDIYGYGINLQGDFLEITNVTSQSSTSFSMVMDGQNTWFGTSGGNVIYQQRGNAGAGVTISSTGKSISRIQLVGTRLYALLDTSLQAMGPVNTTGTGSFVSYSMSGVKTFHVSGTSIYWGDSLFLYKYTSTSLGTAQQVFTNTAVGGYPPIISIHRVEVSGTVYLLLVCRESATKYYIYRYTDMGSYMASLTLLITTTDSIYSVGPSPKPTCFDTYLNQDETDVDCGGSTCTGCAIGKVCSGNGDCLSNNCTAAVCAASCTDDIKNRDETDVDCGGTSCNACETGKSCLTISDCKSNKCTGNVCVVSCSDGIKNQDESDIDCGGLCSKCADDLTCSSNSDCWNGFCNSANICATPTCDDNAVNQNETDIDCGGTICSACPNLSSCRINSDCVSNFCNGTLTCVTPTCTDGAKNQNETDIDCGGSSGCDGCSVGQRCVNDTDCASNMCSNSACVNPPFAVPVPVANPVTAPVTSPVNTPDHVPVADQSPVSAPSTTPSISPPSSLRPQADISTPARSLVSLASSVVVSIIGFVFNLALLSL